MLAAIAFEPVVFASVQVEREVVAPALDPAMAALVREIKVVEGEIVAEPPWLFRFIELCGFGIIGTGLASGLAVLVA